ncbi:hypothetical protein [Erythrobacter sp. EC-HK427]|uniref:hypothetical protein n=1 Tax=Erythrobacter sp. EC-HK427 TaxID=2038396 RepID=UPI0012533DDC|nr:hypothetical protein [Erythrobacter sp. EC-HK427]VVT12172.1 membrane hypothetical protein [Erythrobacter sp. EC-HK427]
MAYLDDFENGNPIETSSAAKVWGSLIVAFILLNLLILVGSEMAQLIIGFVFAIFTVGLFVAFDSSYPALALVWGCGALGAIVLTLGAAKRQRESAMIGWGSIAIMAIGLPVTALHSFFI